MSSDSESDDIPTPEILRVARVDLSHLPPMKNGEGFEIAVVEEWS